MNFDQAIGLQVLPLCAGAGLAVIAAQLSGYVLADRGDDRRSDIRETARRVRLRQASRVYNLFEPLIDLWAREIEQEPPKLLTKLRRDLDAVLDDHGWTAAEWLATQRVAAILWASTCGALVGALMALYWSIALFPAGVGLFYFWRYCTALARLEDEANEVRSLVRRSLPFSIDLMILLLRGGSHIIAALRIVAGQTPQTHWTRHVARMLKDNDRNIPTPQALTLMAQRLGMEEVDGFVSAIRHSMSLGTPMVQVLDAQARQIRDRRSQALERAAHEAENRLVLPNTLGVMACSISFLAPLLISVAGQLVATFKIF